MLKGIPMPQEIKDRISRVKKRQKRTAWNKGTKMSLADKNKLSAKLKLMGRPAWNKGKKITEEHRANIIKAKNKKKK